MSRTVGSKRRRTAEKSSPRLTQRLGAVGEEEPQEVAGVGVEGGEDLVRVDVRRGLRVRDRRPLLDRLAVLGARVELQGHVVEAGAGPEQEASRPRGSAARTRCSISIETTALPSSSSTAEIAPTLIPAMLTLWPCPGVTACAEVSSALSSNWSSPRPGKPLGEVGALLDQDHQHGAASASASSAMIATKSRSVLADRATHGDTSGLGGPTAAAIPLRPGTGLRWQAKSPRRGGCFAEYRLGAGRSGRRGSCRGSRSGPTAPGTAERA